MKGGLNSINGSKVLKMVCILPPFNGGNTSKEIKVLPFAWAKYSVTFIKWGLEYTFVKIFGRKSTECFYFNFLKTNISFYFFFASQLFRHIFQNGLL
jgi:hypothetical protein